MLRQRGRIVRVAEDAVGERQLLDRAVSCSVRWSQRRMQAAQGASAQRRRTGVLLTTHLCRAVDHFQARHGGELVATRQCAAHSQTTTRSARHTPGAGSAAALLPALSQSLLARGVRCATLAADRWAVLLLTGLRSPYASRHLATCLMGKKPASAPPPGQQPGKGAKRPAAADAADIDDLFAQLPKRNARAAVSGGDSAAAGAAGRVRGPGSGFTADGVPPGRPVSRPRGGEAPVRRDKPVVKGRPHYLDNGEKLVPVRCGHKLGGISARRRSDFRYAHASRIARRDASRTGCRCTSRSMTSLTCKRCVHTAGCTPNTLPTECCCCACDIGPRKTAGRPSERGEVSL